jgi:glyoxylase-like metal-dependent hydrolase (beta-lactamase superfamily II)
MPGPTGRLQPIDVERYPDLFLWRDACNVRPPIVPVKVDRALERMDTFEWGGHEIRCLATPGNSPGGMSYMLQLDGD